MEKKIRVTNISLGSITLPDGQELKSYGSWVYVTEVDERLRSFANKKCVKVEEVETE